MKTSVLKRMWMIGVLAPVMAGMIGAAVAGTAAERPPRRPGPPPEAPGAGLRRADESRPESTRPDLHLTQEQREKVRAANQELREQMRQLRADTSLTPEQRREKVRELQEKHAQKMKEILTPEQFERWQQLRQPRGPGAGAGPGPQAGPAGDRPGRRAVDRPSGR